MRYAYLLLVATACGGDDSGGPTLNGYVSVQSFDAIPTGSGGSASAVFFATGAFCTTSKTIGACEIAACPATRPAAVSAGPITIEGAAQPIMLTPTAQNTYDTVAVGVPLFDGGESVTFAAAGATVPAFTKSITTPAKATITAPAKPSSGYLVMNRTTDFTVSWTGGGGHQVQVALISMQSDARVFCNFDASAGTGAIPSDALMTLEAGNISFVMASIAKTTQNAGDWAVEVSAYFNAVWPDSSSANGPAMLQ